MIMMIMVSIRGAYIHNYDLHSARENKHSDTRVHHKLLLTKTLFSSCLCESSLNRINKYYRLKPGAWYFWFLLTPATSRFHQSLPCNWGNESFGDFTLVPGIPGFSPGTCETRISGVETQEPGIPGFSWNP